MVRSGIGDVPKRREDLRFLRGQGRYLDDLAFDRLTHAAVLRSPHAHAHLQSIDTAAKAMPEVLAVLTAADCETAPVRDPTGMSPYLVARTRKIAA